MNILLILGLVLFICCILWVYFLFVSNTINEEPKKQQEEVDTTNYDNPLEECKKLFEEGRYNEVLVIAQKALTRNYGDIDLRKILAETLMKTGDEQMAIMHYEAILSITPFDISIQEFLANYYLENGPKSRALQLYEQILMYDSGNVNAVEALGKLYVEFQEYDKAIQMNEMLLDAEVDEGKIKEYQYILADLYVQVGDDNKAFDMYRKISEKEPENLQVLSTLADLAFKNKYWKDCLRYYEKMIAIVGDDFEILEKIAVAQSALEDWENVVETYKKVISLEDAKSANYLYHQNELCNAMLKCGRCQEAIDLLKDLIVDNPSETSFVFTLANAYASSGNYQIGIDLYQKLMDKLPPEQSEMIINFISNLISKWAQDLFDQGDYTQAFDRFFDALKYNEENDDVYYRLGVCNYYVKSFQDAVSHFKKAISIKPNNPQYYFGLGCTYDEMGLTRNAKDAFQDALNLNPMFVKARMALALTLTKELEYAQSIEQFREVLKYVPDDADTLYNLALAYELVGDIERAIRYYKQALECNIEHKEALNNLELLLGEKYVVPVKEVKEENQDFQNEIEQEPVLQEPVAQEGILAQQNNSADENFDFNFDYTNDENGQNDNFNSEGENSMFS